MLFSYVFFVCLFAVKFKMKELQLLTHTKSLLKSGKYYQGINLWKKNFRERDSRKFIKTKYLINYDYLTSLGGNYFSQKIY